MMGLIYIVFGVLAVVFGAIHQAIGKTSNTPTKHLFPRGKALTFELGIPFGIIAGIGLIFAGASIIDLGG